MPAEFTVAQVLGEISELQNDGVDLEKAKIEVYDTSGNKYATAALYNEDGVLCVDIIGRV
jgi:hypothetical protein